MSPRPFPFQLGVGIDVCRIARIAALLRQESTRNRWARRVFTRIEWMALCRRFERVNQLQAGNSVRQAAKDESHEASVRSKIAGEDLWMLPKLPNLSSIIEDPEAYSSAINDARSPLGSLARHLAGRWAAKEAAIKAHRYRQLSMQDISIVLPTQRSNPLPGANKVMALIEPFCDTVRLSERVAGLRGLRGFHIQSQELPKSGSVYDNEMSEELQHQDQQTQTTKRRHFDRRTKVNESDRQIAEINISHDGDYAVAICMAFDPPGGQKRVQILSDNGRGNPKHEPQWGDEGWFDPHQEKVVEDMRMDDLVKESEDVNDPEAFKEAFRLAFVDSEKDGHRRLPPLP
ncbi:hypothetical protein N7G274_001072 [Stereocaulon virgatum]|uniref:4'-phosphopantetheinyl transferase domain-containing protein n=1 Tax=Stereocaulon virgatum TaxID=373712 RepID=A0ABR4AMT0_9LECA